jgi:hypothetical protein
MESANRVLTRRALDVLKSIATGEYKPSEIAKSDMISEGGPVAPVEAEEDAAETEATSSEAPTESTSAEETETKPE